MDIIKKLFQCFYPILILVITGAQALQKETSSAPLPLPGVTAHSSVALIGTPKYPDDFTHFNYVNPQAPKGGTLRLASIGSFDNLNQYAAKGQPPEFLFMLYDRLMTRSQDEPYSLYPLAAMSVEYPEDLSWVAFNLNPDARFHDGHPMTSEDVVFTVNTLRAFGSPFVKRMVNHIQTTRATSRYRVQFELSENSRTRKAVALLAYLPVLPEHYWKAKDFSHNHLAIPLGSGPMKITKVESGRSITFERVKDYWGADLPVNKGQFNFDRLRIDYYRDNHAALEAFAAGAYDLRIESDPRNWHQKYNFPAIKRGDILLKDIRLKHPHGMSALVFNTRRELFQDRRVRLALNYLFNFEWTNKTLLNSDYQRSSSYYVNTDMAAMGAPSEAERTLLENYRDQLPEAIFHEVIQQPVSDGSGQNRTHRKIALDLLNAAGWHNVNGRMVNKQTGQPMAFELLLSSPTMERVFIPYGKSLSDVGIQVNIQTVDHSRFRKRAWQFNFDMVEWHFWHSSFPGIEQANNWISKAADEPGSSNLAGVKNPVVDQLLEQFGKVRHYEESVALCRALDRILLWNTYVIPKWHKNEIHIAYRKNLAHPHQQDLNWFNVSTWWDSSITKNKD